MQRIKDAIESQATSGAQRQTEGPSAAVLPTAVSAGPIGGRATAGAAVSKPRAAAKAKATFSATKKSRKKKALD